jgi:hypothetical protein
MAASVAQSTSFSFGSNGSVSTEVNRSTYFDNISMPRELEEVETTTFGNDGNRTFLPGLKGATFSGSGNWDATLDAHLAGIFNAGDVVEFEYGPTGNTNGMVKYTGSFFLTSYDINPSVGEKIPFSIAGRIAGAVTRGVFS